MDDASTYALNSHSKSIFHPQRRYNAKVIFFCIAWPKKNNNNNKDKKMLSVIARETSFNVLNTGKQYYANIYSIYHLCSLDTC